MASGVVFGKILLSCASCIVAATCSVIAYRAGADTATVIVCFLAAGVAYPFVAALAITICRVLQVLAIPGSDPNWSCDVRAGLGAIWPLPLAFWIISTPFLAVINRLFR